MHVFESLHQDELSPLHNDMGVSMVDGVSGFVLRWLSRDRIDYAATFT